MEYPYDLKFEGHESGRDIKKNEGKIWQYSVNSIEYQVDIWKNAPAIHMSRVRVNCDLTSQLHVL